MANGLDIAAKIKDIAAIILIVVLLPLVGWNALTLNRLEAAHAYDRGVLESHLRNHPDHEIKQELAKQREEDNHIWEYLRELREKIEE